MLLSQNKIAELTGKDRETIRKRLAGVPFEEGPKRAKNYQSEVALAIVYRGSLSDGDLDISAEEAQRLLTIARRAEIDLNMEVTRKGRPRLEDVTEINEEALGNVAGLLKAHKDKVLNEELINDIFGEMREIGAKLKGLVQ